MPYKDKGRQLEAQRNYYLANKDRYREAHRRNKRRNKEYANCLKIQCCCCGMKDKECLDFHHLGEKTKTICQLVRDVTSIENLVSEIAQCEVICANCHCKKHRPFVISDGSNWKNFEEKRIKKRRWFIGFISQSECEVCGERDSRCLELHHVRQKRYKISYLLTSGHSLEYLKEEISRCEALCANCHRRQHHSEEIMLDN